MRQAKPVFVTIVLLLLSAVPASVRAFESDEPADPRSCHGCDVRLVTVAVTDLSSGDVVFTRASEVVTHDLRHFAVATVGYNDADGDEVTLQLDNLHATRTDGSTAAWDFSDAPALQTGASTHPHPALRYDAAAGALTAIGNSSYACAPGYQTIPIAPAGASVSAMSVEFQKISPNRGGSDYWDLHIGLTPDALQPAIPTTPYYNACESGEPQGYIAQLVGLRVSGSENGVRRVFDAVFNGTADAKVTANHRIGTLYRLDITVQPAPLAQGNDLEILHVTETSTSNSNRQNHILLRNGGTETTPDFDILFTPHEDRACPNWEYGEDEFCSIVRVRGLAPGEVGLVSSHVMGSSPGQFYVVKVDPTGEVAESDESNNFFKNAYAGPEFADLTVAWIWHNDYRSLYAGDTLQVSARVENLAYAASSYSGAFQLSIAIDGQILASQTYDSIGPGWSSGVTLGAPVWNATLGHHEVRAIVTPLAPTIHERRENNERIFLFDVQDPLVPGDLVPKIGLVFPFFPDENLQAMPTAAPLTNYIVIVEVCNRGLGPVRAGEVVATAQARGPAGLAQTSSYVGRFEHGLLAPGNCVGDLFLWRPLLAAGEFDIVAHATSKDDLVEEVVTTNNEDRKSVDTLGLGLGLGAGVLV